MHFWGWCLILWLQFLEQKPYSVSLATYAFLTRKVYVVLSVLHTSWVLHMICTLKYIGFYFFLKSILHFIMYICMCDFTNYFVWKTNIKMWSKRKIKNNPFPSEKILPQCALVLHLHFQYKWLPSIIMKSLKIHEILHLLT